MNLDVLIDYKKSQLFWGICEDKYRTELGYEEKAAIVIL